MLFSKRILVVLDERPQSQLALHRAALIASQMGAALELVWNSEYAPWQDYEAALAELDQLGCSYSKRLESGSLIRFVREHWQQDHFGLLVKGCDASHDGPLLAPRDWRLLRETPCPVLLVKNPNRWAEGPILAAVNPLSAKDNARCNDQAVLMIASAIAGTVDTALHVVTATESPMLLAADPQLQSRELIEARTSEVLAEQLERWHLKPVRRHVGEGPPEHWIPAVATEQGASLVVIGTHARGGLKGALIGNTAEQILDRLSTDIMVLRPGLSEALQPLFASDS